MGDRCCLSGTIRFDNNTVNHAMLDEALNKLGLDREDCDDFSIDEINYAGYDELNLLVDAGADFDVHWCAGSEYGPGAAVCCSGESCFVDAHWDGSVVIRYGDANDLEDAHRYHHLLDLFHGRVNATSCADVDSRAGRVLVTISGGIATAYTSGTVEVAVYDFDDARDDESYPALEASWRPLAQLANVPLRE